MKPNASMITGAMAAEAALAREDTEGLEETIDQLPEDDPLRLEAMAQKKLMGDLTGLPSGHPLLLALNEARLRYEDRMSEPEDEEDPAEVIKIKKAKRLDAKKAATEARNKEEDQNQRLRAASKQMNSSITETMDALQRLSDNIIASQEDFVGERYAQMKLERLYRIVQATMRGVSESKLNPGRVTNG